MPEYNAGEARLRIVPDATGFKRKLEADLKRIQAEYAVRVTADTTRAARELDAFRAREAANAVNLRVDVDTAGAAAKIAALRTALGGLGSGGGLGGPLLLNLGAAGLSLLPVAALGVTQLAGALQQLAQAALVVPGAIGGVVSSVGTLAVGVSGVKDAYTAVTQASAESGRSQEQQARAAVSATNAVRNAVVDEVQARKDQARAYQDARRELEDLNLSLRGGKISEEQAINDALRQRRDLQRDLASGAIKDNLDLQDRLLSIEAADQRVAETHQRNIRLQEDAHAANAKGIEGSDQVTAANERATRATQQRAEAQANLAEVTSQTSAAQAKAAEALAALAPNAREFVQTLVDLKPAFQDLKFEVQDNLFANVSQQLRTLVDSVVPTLKTGLGQIASAWNKNIGQLFKSLGDDESKGLLDRILGNTAEAQDRFTEAIDPLVKGIGTLMAAGSDALPRLADGLASVAERFEAFITAADQDGRLDKWINDGLDGLTNLGNTLLNLGKSWAAITRAADTDLLGTLDSATEKLANFLNSAEGQQKLKDFFAEAREEWEKWKPLFESVPGLLKGLYEGSKQWTDILLPPLEKITGFLERHPELISSITTGFLAWETLKFTGLLAALGSPGKGGKGGTGVLGKLAAAVFLFDILNGGDGSKADFSAGDAAVNILGGAGAGALIAGPPGAVVGAGAGLFATALDAADAAHAQADENFWKNWEESRERNPYQPPTVDGPSIREEFAAKIREGKLPGFTIDPQGVIRDPSGNPVPLPGDPAPPPPSAPVQGPPQPPEVIAPEDLRGLLGGYERGGPTPSGRGPGPTGGWMAEVHGDEWVLPKHARRALGDPMLWALTAGRSFEDGGYIDEQGNPVTPGMLPGPSTPITGPAAVAPNPYGGGGIPGVIGSIASGVQGPIGNLLNLGAGFIPGQGQQSAGASVGGFAPGLWGLPQALSTPGGLEAWGAQTTSWLSGWAGNFLGGLTSSLFGGALSFFGLENSILSPNNPWTGAVLQGVQHFAGLGQLLQQPATTAPQLGSQSITLGDGSTIQIPTFGTASGSGAQIPSNLPIPNNPAAINAISFAQANATGQAYQYGGTGPNYDCSGIASAIYAAAKGLPQGTRYFTTESDFAELGFVRGYMPGALNIGIMRGGGGPNSHMALTLPNGVNVESGGGHRTTAYGGPAKGATDFPLQYFLPLDASQAAGAVPGVYDAGGFIPPGLSLVANYTRKPEPVFTHEEGQAIKAIAKQAATPTPPAPRGGFAEVPDAHLKQLPAEPARVAPSGPAEPAPAPPPPTAAPAAPPPPAALQPAVAPPSSTDHNLPAVDQAISSTASTLGNIASTAASLGLGAAGAGPLAGAAGSLIGGLFQQGGKIVQGIANVGSSFLIGNVTGGTTPEAYGRTLRARQNVPVTAPDRGTRNYTFNGHDTRSVLQEMDLRESIDHQATLAHRPARVG